MRARIRETDCQVNDPALLPTYTEVKRVDPVLLAIAHRYKTLMRSYDLVPFTHDTPALHAFEQRKVCSYDERAREALIRELSIILDDIVARCVELIVDGHMQPMVDRRSKWTKFKDRVRLVIFGVSLPITARVQQGVKAELAKRAGPHVAE